MINFSLIIISYVVAIIHFIFLKEKNLKNFIHYLLFYAILIQIGIMGFFFGFIPHVFYSDVIAQKIGWQPGSPFQIEVGIHDGAWGILGFLSLKLKNGFRLATIIGWSLFMFGAGVGHIIQTVAYGNFEEYNFIMIFVDIFIAIELPILYYINHRLEKKNQ
jgi:hypothetical protein